MSMVWTVDFPRARICPQALTVGSVLARRLRPLLPPAPLPARKIPIDIAKIRNGSADTASEAVAAQDGPPILSRCGRTGFPH